VRFASFIQSYNPHIVTTYNGDQFDYPYILKRMELNFLKFTAELGVSEQSGEFYGSHIAHLDCFCWVERDAFLPQGSRGLKAVAKAKLNYDPIEVEPEDMVWLAKNQTQRLAEYSISDAVATYFLYIKHIHGFILALATIIPMFPD
jgi:DNA polymerase epsilon subunit 1